MARKPDPTQAAPIAFEADDQTLLNQMVSFYHETLKASQEALDYLKVRGIDHPEAIERFQLGYANRTLGLSLPAKRWKAGAEIRGRLTQVGLYRDSGHEHFNGSLVIPVMDEAGKVVQVYGRKLLDNLRKGTPLHLYLPGPQKGVWNLEAMKESKEIILCKSIIDALTFWCAGYRNVTATYGVEGFTPDHLEAFERYGIQRVLIAYDRDEAGNQAAEKLAQRLTGLGIDCYRIPFPKGMDANAYALKVKPAAKSLGQLIRSVESMGSSIDSQRSSAPPEAPVTTAPELEPSVPTAELPEPTAALPAPFPPVPSDDFPHEIQGQDLILSMSDRTYRVRGWQKPLNPETLKVNLMASRGERFHVDTLDLYHAKARTAFIRQAGMELGVSEDALKIDLGKVLRMVETLQANQLAEALKLKDQRPTMTEAEHAEAMALLQSPNLMERILEDFESLGVVGEESNKLTGYLAAVSRLLDRPLALLVQSASAAGKSSLVDAVLDLIPGEDLVRYSAMSGQSLFYMGDRSLSHKILAIAEEEGAKRAAYPLKLLQSEGRVTMASTGKDPITGMLVAHDYVVEGPVSLFLTTTAIDLDEELLNRCLVLTVNESREQTRAIHAQQRSRETLEGLLAKSKRESIIALHRNAQRLLEPLAVVNPYADQLRFQDHQTRSRRDQMKYLTLIRSVALLHQFQREVKTLVEGERTMRYIEVIPKDIELANRLAQEVLGRTVDELLPQTRKLLLLLHEWINGECSRLSINPADFRFTRRMVREALGWGDTQLKVHLGRLTELEYLVAHSGKQGRSFAYELLYQGEDAEGRAKLLGLIDCTRLQGMTATSRGREGHGRGLVGGQSVDSRAVVMPMNASTDGHLPGFPEFETTNAHQGVTQPVQSQSMAVVR